MVVNSEPWLDNRYRFGTEDGAFGRDEDAPAGIARRIESWLSAVLQSDQLALLVGNGLTRAVAAAAGVDAPSMAPADFGTPFGIKIDEAAASFAKSHRGKPNLEDQLTAAMALAKGLEVLGDGRHGELIGAIETRLRGLAESVLNTEKLLNVAFIDGAAGTQALLLLESFLLAFTGRPASRERLHIFTTNYDRLLEFGADSVGLHVLDRFVGSVRPTLRASRLNLDFHYNPPGLRGEPRYLEGVVRLTKLHGSLDWEADGTVVGRVPLPFGGGRGGGFPEGVHDSLMIFPNSAKDSSLFQHPYSELFRDFSAAVVRPNTALVVYGYSFGDDHINRIMRDMLSIPSTHLAIIAWSDEGDRIRRFFEEAGATSQITILVGPQFGDLRGLCERFLPRPSLELISSRENEIRRRRFVPSPAEPEVVGGGASDTAN